MMSLQSAEIAGVPKDSVSQGLQDRDKLQTISSHLFHPTIGVVYLLNQLDERFQRLTLRLIVAMPRTISR